MVFSHISFLNEGEQAEEYKKKKAEKEAHRKQESERNIDRRAGYIQTDREVKKGKLVDVEPHRAKNGVHGEYNRGENEEISKRWDAPRSGYTNTNVSQKSDSEEKYWDDKHRDGDIHKYTSQTSYSPSKEDKERDRAAQAVAKRAIKPGLFPSVEKQREIDIARDTINRHMRRHPEQWKDGKYIGPKKESSIFESVVFLNETYSDE